MIGALIVSFPRDNKFNRQSAMIRIFSLIKRGVELEINEREPMKQRKVLHFPSCFISRESVKLTDDESTQHPRFPQMMRSCET